MRIAILSDNFLPHPTGGAEAVAASLAKAFAARGHEILVVTTSRDPRLAGSTTHEGLRVHVILSDPSCYAGVFLGLINPAVLRSLARVLGDFKPDVVHAHNVHSHLSFASLRVAKRLGARVVLTCHDVRAFHYGTLGGLLRAGDLSVPEAFDYRVSSLRQLWAHGNPHIPFRKAFIQRTLARYVDRVVAVSYALKDALEQNGIQNVEVIHNGIDIAAWDAPQAGVESWKKAHGVGNAAILFGGRISASKGSAQIVQAFADVAGHVRDAQLIVAGAGNGAASIVAQAKKSGVAGRLVMTGWLTGQELHNAYNAAAIVTVPSIAFESLSLMGMEAMACAKPVIATCVGGTREAVLDGTTGYVVNPFDVPSFADKIVGLLKNRELSARFGHAGRERIAREFALSASVDRLETLFSRLPRTHTQASKGRTYFGAARMLDEPVA